MNAIGNHRRECGAEEVLVSQRPMRRPLRGHSDESGYAYLMALFMVLMVIVGSIVVLTNAATEARRQREDDMMWRGKQYVRAIKLYYRKTGHYPQNLEDLEKGVANIHFLRRPYKDPMNKSEDGKWRFIYTNASGQIIGSTRYASMQQMAILDMNGGVLPGAPGSDSAASQDANVTPVPQPGQDTPGANGNCPPALGGNGGANPNPAPGAGIGTSNGLVSQQPSNAPAICQPGQGQGLMQNPQQGGGLLSGAQGQMGGGQFGNMQGQMLQQLAQMKPTGAVDSPVIGGFVVGVGSTVDAKSLRVYKRAKNYKDWEFIWNPLEEQALAVQQGMNQAGGLPGQPGGLGGFGAQPGAGGATGSSPGQTSTGSQSQPPNQQPPQQQPQ